MFRRGLAAILDDFEEFMPKKQAGYIVNLRSCLKNQAALDVSLHEIRMHEDLKTRAYKLFLDYIDRFKEHVNWQEKALVTKITYCTLLPVIMIFHFVLHSCSLVRLTCFRQSLMPKSNRGTGQQFCYDKIHIFRVAIAVSMFFSPMVVLLATKGRSLLLSRYKFVKNKM